MTGELFYDHKDVFANAQYDIRRNIQSGDYDVLIRKDSEQVNKQIHDEYTLELVEMAYEKKNTERVLHGNNLEVSLYIPFTGDKRILKHHPSEYRSPFVAGDIVGDKICIKMASHFNDTNFYRKFESWQNDFDFHLKSANKDADQFKKSLQIIIKTEVDRRVEQLQIADDTTSSIDDSIRKP